MAIDSDNALNESDKHSLRSLIDEQSGKLNMLAFYKLVIQHLYIEEFSNIFPIKLFDKQHIENILEQERKEETTIYASGFWGMESSNESPTPVEISMQQELISYISPKMYNDLVEYAKKNNIQLDRCIKLLLTDIEPHTKVEKSQYTIIDALSGLKYKINQVHQQYPQP